MLLDTYRWRTLHYGETVHVDPRMNQFEMETRVSFVSLQSLVELFPNSIVSSTILLPSWASIYSFSSSSVLCIARVPILAFSQ